MSRLFLSWTALAAGFAVAGGFFAFISLIGIIPRLASVTRTADYVVTYENSLALGLILMNLVSVWQPDLSILPYRISTALLDITALFGGIFIGCLAGALAEVVNVIPILSRRLKMRKGFPWFVFAFALGKCAGSLLQMVMFR
ncbi:MAG: stage V sporulation protein AB [Eubacterium sp.]|nr:stage V sporulation protein AB [Eubacterium sp.]